MSLPTPEGSAPLNFQTRAGALPAEGAPRSEPVAHRVVFMAPNAKSGEPYRGTIAAQVGEGAQVQITQVQLPDALGLFFDVGSGTLYGTPLQAGEHRIVVDWQDAQGQCHAGALMLIVNANPRDLWQCIEPDHSALYAKPNQAACCITVPPNQRLLAASKRGRSHAHAGAFRDDDFWVARDAPSGWSVLVVADGAGSANYSRQGAALAARHAGQHLLAHGLLELGDAVQAWLAGSPVAASASIDLTAPAQAASQPLQQQLYHRFGQAAWSALHAIEAQALAQGAHAKDYATTLLCALHYKTAQGIFVASFWLGDGAICAYGPDGKAHLMGRPDAGEFAGQTRFLDRTILGNSQALWDRIELAHFDDLTALMLMTDGISDPFFETERALLDPAAWQHLWAELAPALAGPEPAEALLRWMDFFKPGCHDDRTLAVWC
jgi:Protein phosphatase 2C